MSNKILSLLGFAAKAGKLSFGFDMTVEAIKKEKSKLIVIANNVSEKTKKEILFFKGNKKTEVITLDAVGIDELSKAVGKKCGIVSVNDKGFAEACLKARIEGGIANDK